MITTTIELIKLTASNGKILTNGEAYGKEIYLGKNDSANNWHEISLKEYEEIVKENDEVVE